LLALAAFLALSADGMESRFFVSMKWLPAGFPGSVTLLALALSADGMESRFFVSMKWLPVGFPGILTTNLAWCFEDHI
jgi:hypothetical protein